MRLFIFLMTIVAVIALLARVAFTFSETEYELPALIVMCILAYFSYDKVIMVVFRYLFRKTYANDAWQYFYTMKKFQTNEANNSRDQIIQYIDTFVQRTYYVHAKIEKDKNGKTNTSYALADGVDQGAPLALIALWETSMSHVAPGPEDTVLVAITGFKVLDLASIMALDFIVLGLQDDQQFELTHESMLSMRYIIMSVDTEAATE